MTMRSEDETRKILKRLEEANFKWETESPRIVRVEFCMLCGRIIESHEWHEHTNHFTIFTDIDHDGIGSTVEALKWQLLER